MSEGNAHMDNDKKKKRDRVSESAALDPDGSRWALEEDKTAQRNETFVWAAKREVRRLCCGV